MIFRYLMSRVFQNVEKMVSVFVPFVKSSIRILVIEVQNEDGAWNKFEKTSAFELDLEESKEQPYSRSIITNLNSLELV